MTASLIRTRYAPSPTGYLHVGGLRTALYNYLFAKKAGGKIILRVEDTDRTRLVEDAVPNFIDIFNWLGIEFDEGPRIGGEYGPYVQSERLELYREHLRQLADQGLAYPCFCSAERLQQMRDTQIKSGQPPMYDRACRNLSAEESARRIAQGEAHVWRMAVPDKQLVEVQDLIRGDVSFESSTIDDQVLLKSDGYPTYHLANVIDDHRMKISHVIRGEEWLPSTPKHVLLYKFFNWDLPRFAHLPLLLNPDRSKMSKRSGDVAVEDYRRKGTLPDALINFVALLGWHPSDDREIFSLAELVSEFSLERVNKAGAVFDTTKLAWMNAEYIKRESDEELTSHILPLISESAKSELSERLEFTVATLRGGTEAYQSLADRISELAAPLGETDAEMMALLESAEAASFLKEFTAGIEAIPADTWNRFENLADSFKELAKASGKSYGMKGKTLWMTLRAALTGQPHGPELPKLIGIWGRARTLQQLNTAVHYASQAISE
ncbi:glutamate--tRNA ligase [bacterium]|nr:glutamate--tRNA ligase [bacterium]